MSVETPHNTTEKFSSQLAEWHEGKLRQHIARLFYDVPESVVIQLMENAGVATVVDSQLTRKEFLIDAVVRGLGRSGAGKYDTHPNSLVRESAKRIAYEQLAKDVTSVESSQHSR